MKLTYFPFPSAFLEMILADPVIYFIPTHVIVNVADDAGRLSHLLCLYQLSDLE